MRNPVLGMTLALAMLPLGLGGAGAQTQTDPNAPFPPASEQAGFRDHFNALDKKRWYVGVAVGYVLAFTMLSLALAGGMALGVAYGIWAASGVALTAILSKFLFKEPFTWLMGLGIVLIVGGVLCIELGAVH